MKNIAIFASGSGSNAENIIKYFSTRNVAKVCCVLSNRHDAPVLDRAAKLNVDTYFFDRADFYESSRVLDYLKKKSVDFIVLAGFLWLVPDNILDFYHNSIVNIHPALLPRYGGKGMYGDKVHRAVINNSDKESGITIHHVNSVYDDGSIIFQARCEVKADDTPETLAARIHELEYKYYPEVIEDLIGITGC